MALNAEVVGVCVSRMCGSERVEVTGTLLSSPFADIFVDVASESEKSPGVRKFTLDFFFHPRCPSRDRTCNLRFFTCNLRQSASK